MQYTTLFNRCKALAKI